MIKKGVFSIFVCIAIVLSMYTANADEITQTVEEQEVQVQPKAEGLDHESNDVTLPQNELNNTVKKESEGEEIQPLTTTEYIIQDVELRKYINKALGKSGTDLETYSASVSELASIYSLRIGPSTGEKALSKIDTFKGIEYLTGIDTLEIMNCIIPEESLTDTSKLTSLYWLDINYVFYSGNDATATLIDKKINGELHSGVYTLSIDNSIDLSPLGNLTELGYFIYELNGIQENNANEGGIIDASSVSARTYHNLSGLSNLKNLVMLGLTSIVAADSEDFHFLSSMTSLDELVLYDSTALHSLDTIATLPSLSVLNINGTSLKDYTPIIDKPYFKGAGAMTTDLKTQYYTEEDRDGITTSIVRVNTGIKYGSDITSINFTTIDLFKDTFEVDSYEVVDGSLVINFILHEATPYKQMNWLNGTYDIERYGFTFGINATLANGKKVNHDMNLLDIGKVIEFDPNYEGSTKTISNLNAFDNISAPTLTREGYVFEGWYTDAACTSAFDFTTIVTTNTTLYAKWDKANEIVTPPEVAKPSEDPKEVVAPKTGDYTNRDNLIVIWIISGLILTLTMLYSIKKKQEKTMD